MWAPSSGTYLELAKTVLQTVASQYHLPWVASGRCWCKTHWGSPPNNSPSNTNCKKHLPSQQKWPTKGRAACMTPLSWHCIEWSKLIARLASLSAWTLHDFLIQEIERERDIYIYVYYICIIIYIYMYNYIYIYSSFHFSSLTCLKFRNLVTICPWRATLPNCHPKTISTYCILNSLEE